MKIVCNASPLIRIGKLDLLRELYGELIIIPQAIRDLRFASTSGAPRVGIFDRQDLLDYIVFPFPEESEKQIQLRRQQSKDVQEV